MRTRVVLVLSASLLVAAPAALAQQPSSPSRTERATKAAGDLATQPVEDVGLKKKEIPPILIQAGADPYALPTAITCQQLADEIGGLSATLGPDYDARVATRDDKTERLAVAGGKSVVGSLVPFRGLVREASGAAAEARAYQAAVEAGYARRGFLRGIHRARNCKTALPAPAPAA